MGKHVTLARTVVESWDWTQNVYFNELINFIGRTFFDRALVFEIIEIIG